MNIVDVSLSPFEMWLIEHGYGAEERLEIHDHIIDVQEGRPTQDTSLSPLRMADALKACLAFRARG